MRIIRSESIVAAPPACGVAAGLLCGLSAGAQSPESPPRSDYGQLLQAEAPENLQYIEKTGVTDIFLTRLQWVF
jgi:hypothetical protein